MKPLICIASKSAAAVVKSAATLGVVRITAFDVCVAARFSHQRNDSGDGMGEFQRGMNVTSETAART